MIDVNVKITIDEEHEAEYENILNKIGSIEGIVAVGVDVNSYFEYNVDSTPYWTEDEEEEDGKEITEENVEDVEWITFKLPDDLPF